MPGARRRPRILILPILSLLAALALAPGVAAADQEITSTGPLDQIIIGDQLNCQVAHTADTSFEFFPSGTRIAACGTFVALAGTLYSPADVPAGSSAEGTPFTIVSQTPVTGSGTAASPYQIVTIVTLGTSGVTLTETDSYVVGNEFYRTDVTLVSAAQGALTGYLYRAGDCYLQNSDLGFGSVDAPTGSVRCVAAADPAAVTPTPGTRIEEWVPLTAGSSYYQANFSEVWSLIGSMATFPNTCECDLFQDNGAGLSWPVSLAAGGTLSFSHLTNFSPQGFSVAGTPTPTPSPTPPPASVAPTAAALPNTASQGLGASLPLVFVILAMSVAGVALTVATRLVRRAR